MKNNIMTKHTILALDRGNLASINDPFISLQLYINTPTAFDGGDVGAVRRTQSQDARKSV